ncbi:MAG: 5'/3'-nucleotidase SurE [Hyphomicrobiales bacterium]|nr:5'/3'-nucleotidase SurE [Hyphomicrobiales bacterium]MBV8770284.1 5'/3'-nucleotidase SurE [Hyphomicrobiales bacterium]MBV9137380.1 5'/3'-nucleotidase SurE [Hyphomicrobiales bacterium]MBV9591015.1 5'/3'-nucleotidase SurE [Hyphomicrobiales bacterium]MBV9754205.1 5'/3'-nucleotidase SurE [Hyphomicrobiales bacterium]
MRILITNDDGVHADGLEICAEVAAALSDDVWIVAPETDQSGVAHALSLSDPLRLRKIDERRFAVKGTPTDCVILATRHVFKGEKPGLVLSGVNRGQNVAEDVLYSGTVAGAMEGAMLGVPAIALSQAYGPEGREKIHWDCARTHALPVLRKLLDAGIPRGTLFNINFPHCKPDGVTGAEATSQGQRDQALLSIDERKDGRGNAYFWLGFARGITKPRLGTDMAALDGKRISVTPLQLNLTHQGLLEDLARTLA